MNELIECRECTSPNCRGCNQYILYQALREGKLDGLMNENKRISVPGNVTVIRHGKWFISIGKDGGPNRKYLSDLRLCLVGGTCSSDAYAEFIFD